MDELNQHECMARMVALLRHMQTVQAEQTGEEVLFPLILLVSLESTLRRNVHPTNQARFHLGQTWHLLSCLALSLFPNIKMGSCAVLFSHESNSECRFRVQCRAIFLLG